MFLVIFAKEELSKQYSADSDVFGSRSSTADSVTKSSDKVIFAEILKVYDSQI